MTEAETSAIRINAYIHALAPFLYGKLRLMPEQVDNLTFLEIYEIKHGIEEEEMRQRWETAYWTSIIVQPHIKSDITVEMLMKPFLPEKTAQEIIDDKNDIKKIFGLD